MRGIEGSVRGQSLLEVIRASWKMDGANQPRSIPQGLFGAGPSARRTYLVDQPTSRISSALRARIHTDSDCCAFDLAPTTKAVSWNIILVFLDQKHKHIKKGPQRSLRYSALAHHFLSLCYDPFQSSNHHPLALLLGEKSRGANQFGD